MLQGGGALGAYQAGVYEALTNTAYQPNWVAGVSIGAINAALIAGNPPERRVARLREFWERVSSGMSYLAPSFRRASRRLQPVLGALLGDRRRAWLSMGPRAPQFWSLTGADTRTSIYDTAPLRDTLLSLIDFDLINSKKVRLSVGAVSVTTGNSVYFDNMSHTIGPEHVMASGALPPAFPAVEIDGHFYWDGGIVSNTPLQYVLDTRGTADLLVLSVDLFSARGELPTTLADVMARQKDIQYSSRTRYNTDMAAKVQNTRQAARDLLMALPAKIKSDPGIIELQRLLVTPPVDIVHLIYRQRAYEHESKDYEFSRASVLEHWQAGLNDMRDSVAHPDWLSRSGLDDGVAIYDLTRPEKH